MSTRFTATHYHFGARITTTATTERPLFNRLEGVFIFSLSLLECLNDWRETGGSQYTF